MDAGGPEGLGGRQGVKAVTDSRQDLFGPSGTPTVIVIGAGLGGVAAGVKLKRAGIETFQIFERSPSAGGTWWDNDYPGCEVDVGSYLYSYSFKQRYAWTRTHATQPELLRYIQEVIDEQGLRPHIRLGTAVTQAEWDEARHIYRVTLDNGEVHECNVLISAVGFLNTPRYPTWPGLEDFAGPKFHTFHWEHEHDLTGKKVAIVGTGSTATQIVPMLAPTVDSLTLFQREPGWIIPKGDRDYSPEDMSKFRRALSRRRERIRLFVWLEMANFRRAIYRPGTKVNDNLEKICRDFIDAELADHPELRQAVTPSYPFPGKRPIFNQTFYAALKADNVTLIPRAVTEVTPKGIVDTEGTEHQVDVIVMATGFQPTNYLASFEIIGRQGRSLHETWAGEPEAFLGMTVPGFPNFYMLYGPNTNGGEIIYFLEHQSAYAVRAMKRMMGQRVTAIEVRPGAFRTFNRWMQRNMHGTSWLLTSNYFKAATGKVVTQWPHGALFYGFLTNVLGRISSTARRAERVGPTAAASPVTSEPAAR
ncbi:MAG: NAD(P)/FAD-dependent oxidoreductase [Acidimicrobiales bacterium]